MAIQYEHEIELTYVSGHDAFDEGAYYLNGELVGRDTQISVRWDILPKLQGGRVVYAHLSITPDPAYDDGFWWPDSLDELLGDCPYTVDIHPGFQTL